MDRKMFEGIVNNAEDEARKGNKRRDEILANKKAEEAELAEIEGKPESQAEQKEIFKLWRTIELGTGLKTAKDFEKALKKAGREISSEARNLLAEVEKEIAGANTEKRSIDLVDATPAELGLPEGGTLEQIYGAAEKHGLEKCPAEAGPQSAIQFEDQPKGEYRLIGMNPAVDSDGYRHVFSVSRVVDGERWLSTDDDRPGDVWHPDYHFVFVRRKKSELKT